MPDKLDDEGLAARLAGIGADIACRVRDARLLEPGPLGDAGDRIVDTFIGGALRHTRPGDGILSEETACDGSRLGRRRAWIVDPLDGTREFAEGRDDWAVHVGLSVDGAAAVGAVALPAAGLVFRSDRPAPLPPAAERPRIAVSRTRPPEQARAAAAMLGGELVPMGSAGFKAMAVVRGLAEAYVHAGGQHQWDSCAPVAVARAHGLHCSRLDGSPLVYNGADTRLDDLLICRPELAERILRAVA